MTKRNHCGNFRPLGVTRRDALKNAACGFGSVALASLLADKTFAGLHSDDDQIGVTHHPAKVKQIVYLYMDGGPSQVDTFDPKPRLAKEHGKPFFDEDRTDSVQQHWKHTTKPLEIQAAWAVGNTRE